MSSPEKPVIAVCGKGKIGKTVLSTLVARAMLDDKVSPLLLVDADPVGRLHQAIGARPTRSLATVRDLIVSAARDLGTRDRIARGLDYLLLEALEEREDHALLVMGRANERGCYCPVNRLLRQALEQLTDPFAAVIIDAEAGLEQISREVTSAVNRIVVVVDGSRRSLRVLDQIVEMTAGVRISVVTNRVELSEAATLLPEGAELLGALPEDEQVRDFDRRGQPLWELPPTNPVRRAARGVALPLSPA